MAFPTTLDNFTPQVNGEVIEVADINELQTAIEALEAKVGIDSSAVNTSHDYKLSGVATGDKAMSLTGTEVGTNKTFTSPVLTTPVINVGSDANYDLYYRFNGILTRLPIVSGKVLKSTGGVLVWETETTVVDASATVKGVLELATAAEITAGTATGGTGAPLAVTPDQLALSTPVFNGSSLTNIPRWLASSGTDVVNDNSAAEVTMLTYSLAGGILGTNKGVRIRGVLTYANASSTTNCTFKIKYGGTTISTFSDPNSSTTNISGTHVFDLMLIGAGTTGTQEASVMVISSGASAACPIAQVTLQTSSIDSTTAQDIVITSQMSSAAVGRTATLKNYFIHKIV